MNAFCISTNLKDTIRDVLTEIDPKKFDFTDETTKKALDLANQSYQKHDKQIERLTENDLRQDKAIARLIPMMLQLYWDNKRLVKNEKLQTMNEKTHSRDITENSSLDKDKKFEDDL